MSSSNNKLSDNLFPNVTTFSNSATTLIRVYDREAGLYIIVCLNVTIKDELNTSFDTMLSYLNKQALKIMFYYDRSIMMGQYSSDCGKYYIYMHVTSDNFKSIPEIERIGRYLLDMNDSQFDLFIKDFPYNVGDMGIIEIPNEVFKEVLDENVFQCFNESRYVDRNDGKNHLIIKEGDIMSVTVKGIFPDYIHFAIDDFSGDDLSINYLRRTVDVTFTIERAGIRYIYFPSKVKPFVNKGSGGIYHTMMQATFATNVINAADSELVDEIKKNIEEEIKRQEEETKKLDMLQNLLGSSLKDKTPLPLSVTEPMFDYTERLNDEANKYNKKSKTKNK